MKNAVTPLRMISYSLLQPVIVVATTTTGSSDHRHKTHSHGDEIRNTTTDDDKLFTTQPLHLLRLITISNTIHIDTIFNTE